MRNCGRPERLLHSWGEELGFPLELVSTGCKPDPTPHFSSLFPEGLQGLRWWRVHPSPAGKIFQCMRHVFTSTSGLFKYSFFLNSWEFQYMCAMKHDHIRPHLPFLTPFKPPSTWPFPSFMSFFPLIIYLVQSVLPIWVQVRGTHWGMGSMPLAVCSLTSGQQARLGCRTDESSEIKDWVLSAKWGVFLDLSSPHNTKAQGMWKWRQKECNTWGMWRRSGKCKLLDLTWSEHSGTPSSRGPLHKTWKRLIQTTSWCRPEVLFMPCLLPRAAEAWMFFSFFLPFFFRSSHLQDKHFISSIPGTMLILVFG